MLCNPSWFVTFTAEAHVVLFVTHAITGVGILLLWGVLIWNMPRSQILPWFHAMAKRSPFGGEWMVLAMLSVFLMLGGVHHLMTVVGDACWVAKVDAIVLSLAGVAGIIASFAVVFALAAVMHYRKES